MERVLAGLQPEKYFYYFEEISRIPRSSYQEKAVSDYVVNFARERGLEAVQDEAWNVIVNKPATPGYENRKGIILQGHMDMVCVKDEGVDHDFEKDPLELYIDGEWVKARGTTLGADNGTAIAMMLMILDSDDVAHPALQCIFTTGEEIGLEGASRLDPNLFQGAYLINMDGSGFEKLLLSSAGASNHLFRIDRELTSVTDPQDKTALKLTVNGMTSGHSGGLIHQCMGNAIKVLGDVLNDLDAAVSYELAEYTGGSKMNAIAKASEAVVVIRKADAEKAKEFLEEQGRLIYKEYVMTDPEVSFQIQETAVPEQVFGADAKAKTLAFVDLLFDGAYKFMNQEKSMARTSNNIGILSVVDGKLEANCLMRSNSDYQHRQLMRKTDRMARLVGIQHEVKNPFPAWEYDPENGLVQKLFDLYQRELGYTPEVVMTHGGMEPGTIVGLAKSVGKKIEAMNMGVKCEGAHTTAEKMNIPAVQATFDWLKKILVSLD